MAVCLPELAATGGGGRAWLTALVGGCGASVSLMNDASKKSLVWGISLLVAGTLLMAWGPDLAVFVSGGLNGTSALGFYVADFALALVRNVAFPLGAALIAAAVVIEALRPREDGEA